MECQIYEANERQKKLEVCMATGERSAQLPPKRFGKKLLVICGKEIRPNVKGESFVLIRAL